MDGGIIPLGPSFPGIKAPGAFCYKLVKTGFLASPGEPESAQDRPKICVHKPRPSPMQGSKVPLWRNTALAKGCPDSHLWIYSMTPSGSPRPPTPPFCSSHTTSLPPNTINTSAGNEALTHEASPGIPTTLGWGTHALPFIEG